MEYNAALKEHAEAAVKKEKGVLMLYAVHDKDNPINITVYKATVEHMVKSLILTDVELISLQMKF